MLNKLVDLSVVVRSDPLAAAEAEEPHLTATAEQKLAIEQISHAQGRFQTLLIEGVTGSGKTEIYLQSIAQVVAKAVRHWCWCQKSP